MSRVEMNHEDDRPLRSSTFHQARWNEPVLFELHSPGESGVCSPIADPDVVEAVGDPADDLPGILRRAEAPALPEIGQMRVLKHYLRLSQETLGADFNVEIGQGTCTMKYNPKVHEVLVRHPKMSEIHPMQEPHTVQGSLQILHETDLYLREISGLDRFSFHPRSGTHAILAMASMVRAHHEQTSDTVRDEIITTMFSHPSDAAAGHVLGFKIINLDQDPSTGLPSLEKLKEVASDRTAALFITNPEDTGIFNPDIRQFTDAVHAVGGLCAYDQANANGLLGMTRAREAGFDMCFFNLHKTFSIPHACGGPACGAVGVTDALEKYLPGPIIDFDGEVYTVEEDRPSSIGKIGAYIGCVPAVVRAYAWIRALGASGLRDVAQIAVLNNNYLLARIREIPGVDAPYSAGTHRLEQVRYSWQELYEKTGVTTEDITRRMADHGMHMWSSHHPFIVPNPMTLEPTEAYSREELDQYVEALRHVAEEAWRDPEIVKSAPHRSCIHAMDSSWFDDPKRWAITWRAYVRKRNEGVYEDSEESADSKHPSQELNS
jgi:glycine dehydrogenase subunit 2